MIHGHLSHLKQPGSASGGVGRMDGMSSECSKLTVVLPKDGRVGERLLHSPAGVKDGGLEFCEPAAERRIGWVVRDDEGHPVGALLGLVLQRLGAGCVACSSVSFALQVMAPTQEPPLHLVTAGVEHFHVHAEPS